MSSANGGMYAFVDIKGGATGKGALLKIAGFTMR